MRNFCKSNLKDLSLIFASGSFSFWFLIIWSTFNYMIHFDLTFVYCPRYRTKFTFLCAWPCILPIFGKQSFFLSCLSTFVKNYLYMCVNSPLDFYSVSWIDSAVVMPVTLFFLWLNLKSCSQIAFSNFILLELFWFLWVFVGNIESPFHFLQIFLLEFLSWLCCICRSIWSSLVTQW